MSNITMKTDLAKKTQKLKLHFYNEIVRQKLRLKSRTLAKFGKSYLVRRLS